MQKIKISLIIITSVVLSGCGATLKDFQKMTPGERTSKTCNNDYVVKHHKDREKSYFREISNLETLLMNGYKTVQNCSTTVIDDRHTYLYTSFLENNTKHVPQDPKKRIIKRCRNEIVPLTPYAMKIFEERKIELMPLLDDARKRKQDAFDSCFGKVIDLSAEKAFGYYKN